jgi:hypothetical protein
MTDEDETNSTTETGKININNSNNDGIVRNISSLNETEKEILNNFDYTGFYQNLTEKISNNRRDNPLRKVKGRRAFGGI